MQPMIEAIRAAVAEGASAEQKAHGAAACRAILAALDAEPGKPITIANAPTPHPLAGIDAGTALDLLIAKLTAALPKSEGEPTTTRPAAPESTGLRIAFVPPPVRPRSPQPPTRRRR